MNFVHTSHGRIIFTFPDGSAYTIDIDAYIAKKLRMSRLMLGISVKEIAKNLGVSVQQIYKYEQATNRISASQLYILSRTLSIPISYFFDGVDTED